LEEEKRIEDYVMFMSPKLCEGLWDLFKRFGYVKDISYLLQIMFALAMGLFLTLKVHYPEKLPSGYYGQLSFLFGK